MSLRVVLTAIWLCGLVVSLVIVELYFHLTVDGIPFLIPQDRSSFLPPVATIYGVIITGILGPGTSGASSRPPRTLTRGRCSSSRSPAR